MYGIKNKTEWSRLVGLCILGDEIMTVDFYMGNLNGHNM